MKIANWLGRHGVRNTSQLFYALPLVLMFLLALTPGISFTEDLGRHLLLGKIIVATGRVPDINLLTYTYPDFPFINHHWLSEVVFYFAHCAVGLNGLILLKALLMCAALALAMRSVSLSLPAVHPDRASRIGMQAGRASPLIGFAATLAAIVLGYRAHIRPELFTYLGVALYGWFITRAECSPDKKLSGRNWAILIAHGWFWANAHIYFIFGIGMIFCYWLVCFLRNLINANAVTPRRSVVPVPALKPFAYLRSSASACSIRTAGAVCSIRWAFSATTAWPSPKTPRR